LSIRIRGNKIYATDLLRDHVFDRVATAATDPYNFDYRTLGRAIHQFKHRILLLEVFTKPTF
jgi:hypothetical protein